MYVVASDAAAVPVSGLDLDIGITVLGFRQIASISKKFKCTCKAVADHDYVQNGAVTE